MNCQVIWTLNGGLGNQIFQYLASLHIQDKLGITNIKYCTSDYIQHGYRDLDIDRLVSINVSSQSLDSRSFATRCKRKISRLAYSSLIIHNSWLSRYLLPDMACLDESLFEDNSSASLQGLCTFMGAYASSSKTFCVEGYWQNPSPYLDGLCRWRSLFKSSAAFVPEEWSDVAYLSIHIRRGDYLNPTGYDFFFSRFHPVQYLQHALQLIPSEFQHLPVLVVTDDQSWANYYMSLLLKGKKFYVSSSEDPLVDWSILANSTFSIIGNSTFSLTAAMLNLKSYQQRYRVIMPQWINAKESSTSKNWDMLPGSIIV